MLIKALLMSAVVWLVARLSTLFASRLGSWLVGAMLWIGLSWSVHNLAVDPFLAQIQTVATGLPGDAVGWFAFLNFDKYLSAVISAYGAAAAVTGGRAVLTRRAV